VATAVAVRADKNVIFITCSFCAVILII